MGVGVAVQQGQDAVVLSRHLRTETRREHDAVERVTGWPGSIGDVSDYRACLRGLLSIWRPFEAALADQGGWDRLDVGCRRPSRVPALEHDLRALGEDPATVPSLAVAVPKDVAGTVGVVYVLEGSALGGRVIRGDLLRRLGPAVADATAFLSGRGEATGPAWRDIVLAVDRFGVARPEDWRDVVSGARATFTAFLQAFQGGAAVASVKESGS